jgi:Protein of unknown function (DUF2934)
MDVTPTNTPSKGARAKVVKTPAAEKPARKTLTTARKKATTSPAVIIAPKAVTSMDLQSEIEKTAFYLAAERHFEPGHELDDWLEAERRIKASRSS